MVSSISPQSNGGLAELLRSLQKEQEALLGDAVPESIVSQSLVAFTSKPPFAHSSSANPMSQHFTSNGRETSRYVQATLAEFQTSKQVATQQTSRVSALLDSLGGIKVGDEKGSIHTAAWYEMQMRRIQNVETSEESERNLNEIKDNITQKAQEATAPKDANGNPIDELPNENTGESTPMPEISGSNPAPTPDVSIAPAFDVAPVSVPAVTISSILTTYSVDIIV